MFFSMFLASMLFLFFYLWGDYMKILIFMEIVSLVFLSILIFMMKFDYFSMNYFFSCLIFLVCESSLAFLLFIFYISMESDLVKKMMLVQF